MHLATLFGYCIFFFCHHPFIPSYDGGNDPAPDFLGDVAINCGSLSNSAGFDGREWIAEAPVLEPKGKSKSSTIAKDRSFSADPIPYMTARISTTQFSYTFQVKPGQKFVRLHFHPSSYRGFEKSQDFFTVKAGPFTLLKNFSASLAADAMGVKYLVKEFCLNVEENKRLNLTFSPSKSSKLRKTYAFVNGIEIISMPTGLYYTPDGDFGAPIVGRKNRFYCIDNSTALEMVQRLNIGGSSILPVEDFGMFRRWSEDANYLITSELQPANHLVRGIKFTSIPAFTAPLKIYQTSRKTSKNGKAVKMHDFTWKIPVDLGFGYLVRLHFCDFKLEMTVGGQREFSVLINNQVAEAMADVIRLSGGIGVPIYRDYMVMVEGEKEAAGKCDLLIALQSSDQLAIGLFLALEIFKLSNDNNLASPNPVYPVHVPTSWSLKIRNLLSAFGQKNAIVTVITILLILLNLIVFKLRQIWEENWHEGEDARAASTEQSCRRFSLAEIISATQNFSDALLIGKGGFGKVYKGIICGGSDIVAVKRLNLDSGQGAQEFWTEIETLSKIRHIHLVSLIGYCNEYQEMILVYQYMPRGTLADNLYKIGRNGKDGAPLTWEQRLKICIGAARGLDYLHTGIEYGVIHRDVKDSNILLDENFVAKISDFGLSKLGKVSESQSDVSTKVKGTFGFLDPDYFMTHKPTRKTDVYAFGVVLLVVLCGRPAVDRRIPGEPQSLLSMFRESMTKGDINDIVDPSLRGNFSSESLKEFIKSVENCLDPQPKKRPTMSQVVTSLEYSLEPQRSTMSSKSEEAATSGQPCKGGVTQTTRVDLQSIWPWGALRKRRKNSKKRLLLEAGFIGNFQQIKAATNNFAPDKIIGRGDFGAVYMGTLPNGTEVAVKHLSKRSKQGVLEFVNETGTVYVWLKHPNLVRLMGCFAQEYQPLLVYEYMKNNSLDHVLFGPDQEVKAKLDWRKRVKICLDVAKGLAYLHEESALKLIHGHIKSTNILLDKNFNAKISNFGLARLDKKGITPVNTQVKGTAGYIAPERMAAKYSSKVDVYSFGILTLEIISGQQSCTPNLRGQTVYLLEMAYDYLRQGNLLRVLDSSLGSEYNAREAKEIICLAMQCTNRNPYLRPTMAQVVRVLKGKDKLDNVLIPINGQL